MENQVNVSDQNPQQIEQNFVSQPVISEKPKINYLAMTGVILVCFVVFGFGGYYLGKQSPQSQKYVNGGQNQVPSSTIIPMNDANILNLSTLDFVKKLEEIHTFSGSENVRKRVVIFRETDQQEEATVYLTNDTFDKSSLVKIATIGFSETEFGYSQDSGRKFFYLLLNGPGDYQEIILADENGTVIATDVIARNAQKIGLGTTIRGQYYIKVRGAWLIDNKASMAVLIPNAYDEEYEVMIDGYTGDYVDGSLKKLK